MKHPLLMTGALLSAALVAVPTQAADVPLAIMNAARCATRASNTPLPLDVLRVIGSQDPSPKALYGSRDLLIVDAGTGRGIGVDQRYAIRRVITTGQTAPLAPRAVDTAGWLRIVAANETTSIGLVEFACQGIQRGDYLELDAELVLPANLDRADISGELDFTAPAHVMFGEMERLTGGVGDFMVIDAGAEQGVQPGARFAIYRNVNLTGVPLVPVGEAMVVRADPETAVVRLTMSRDAIQRGDLMVPRKP